MKLRVDGWVKTARIFLIFICLWSVDPCKTNEKCAKKVYVRIKCPNIEAIALSRFFPGA